MVPKESACGYYEGDQAHLFGEKIEAQLDRALGSGTHVSVAYPVHLTDEFHNSGGIGETVANRDEWEPVSHLAAQPSKPEVLRNQAVKQESKCLVADELLRNVNPSPVEWRLAGEKGVRLTVFS